MGLTNLLEEGAAQGNVLVSHNLPPSSSRRKHRGSNATEEILQD